MSSCIFFLLVLLLVLPTIVDFTSAVVGLKVRESCLTHPLIVAFLLTIYSDCLQATHQNLTCDKGQVGPQEILSFAKSQVDYILGSNPMGMSYLVGYGPEYPQRLHHRGASIDSYQKNKGFIGCTQGYDSWYGRQGPNPNVLVGALVRGPDGNDGFRDERWNHMQTEACTYNTATLLGVLAKLDKLEGDYLSLNRPLIASS